MRSRLLPCSVLVACLLTPLLASTFAGADTITTGPMLASLGADGGYASRRSAPPLPKVEVLNQRSQPIETLMAQPAHSEGIITVTEDHHTDAGSLAAWWKSVDRWPVAPKGIGPDEVWVYIDATEQNLSLMKGDRRLQFVEHVAFGAGGAKSIRLRGSRLTPKGGFRIDQINPQSQYHRFFRIDYPNPAVAEQALAEGVINQSTHDYIKRYYARHGRAPMNTPLGGYLGLHGLGNKSPFLHQRVQWTDGCTAVTNEEISALEPWLRVGTRVIIE